jgi:hypothetical protein
VGRVLEGELTALAEGRHSQYSDLQHGRAYQRLQLGEHALAKPLLEELQVFDGLGLHHGALALALLRGVEGTRLVPFRQNCGVINFSGG